MFANYSISHRAQSEQEPDGKGCEPFSRVVLSPLLRQKSLAPAQ